MRRKRKLVEMADLKSLFLRGDQCANSVSRECERDTRRGESEARCESSYLREQEREARERAKIIGKMLSHSRAEQVATTPGSRWYSENVATITRAG